MGFALGMHLVHPRTSLWMWLFGVTQYSAPPQWCLCVDLNSESRVHTEFQNRFHAARPSCNICVQLEILWSCRHAPFQWYRHWMLNKHAALQRPWLVCHKLNCTSLDSTICSCRAIPHCANKQSRADSKFSICFGISYGDLLDLLELGKHPDFFANILCDRMYGQWQPFDNQLRKKGKQTERLAMRTLFWKHAMFQSVNSNTFVQLI